VRTVLGLMVKLWVWQVEYEWNVQDRELGIHAVLKDQGDQPIALELCNAYLECKSTRRWGCSLKHACHVYSPPLHRRTALRSFLLRALNGGAGSRAGYAPNCCYCSGWDTVR
jgi:hypothetical protein